MQTVHEGTRSAMTDSVLERLRVYKQVCRKIRSSLVAGREEVVSPSTVCRSFLDSYENMIPATSTDSGIFPGDARESPQLPFQSECPFVEAADGWTVEYSERRCERCSSSGLCVCPRPSPSMELRQLAEAAYRQHFHQQDHWNYFTEEPDIGPCVMSIKQEGDGKNFRLLVRSSDHYLHGTLPAAQLGVTQLTSHDEVVSAVGREMGLSKFFKPAQFPDISKELLRIDETFVKAHHKVGVLRVKQGQRSEEEIFSNSHEPGAFDEFLGVLGNRVKLQGFDRFLGGLDNEKNLTGEYSVFTEFQGLDVMFHVSTLMPFDPNDPQQVNKKRHIGNDIVCIAYLDSAHTVFDPTWVRSHFVHCYAVVQHVVGAHGQPLYKVAVVRRSTVPSFSPELKHMGVFAHSRTLQQFLLTKIINGERASYHAPRFFKLTNRSRAQLLLEFTSRLTEYAMACRQGRATRKICRRSNWLPIGASRPPSPMMDSVREKFTDSCKLAEDLSLAFQGCELADVVFIVGEDRIPLYGVKAILACRSRVFRTMFKELHLQPLGSSRLTSPLLRKRMPSGSSLQYMSPQSSRKGQPGQSKSKLPALSRKKNKSVPEYTRDVSPEPSVPYTFTEDPRNIQIKEQYVVEGFTEVVFSELLNYVMTGGCSIKSSNIVGLACAAEKFEVEELKQACLDRLTDCLSVESVCYILTQLEKFLSFSSSKTMIVQCLEFVDSNAGDLLASQQFLRLSENMVHLVLRRDTDVEEIVKVKAAFAWGELNTKPEGPDFKTLVTPLVKHVRLHMIDPQDIMKTLVPSGLFDMEKVMAALAYQVDPKSVQEDNYTMFRPRKKSNVLSSR